MSEYVDAEALSLPFETLSGETAALSAGDILFAAMAAINFGSPPAITQFRRGGSGGAVITPSDSDALFFFGNSAIGRSGEAAAAGETVYGAVTGALQLCLAGAVYADVESTHDYTVNSGVDGSGTTTVASVTIPNCVTGEVCSAFVFGASDSINMADYTAVAGTTIRAQHRRVGEGFLTVAVLEKTAAADGDCVLSVNVNADGVSAVGLAWLAMGRAMVGSGGGPTFLAAWARGANQVHGGH